MVGLPADAVGAADEGPRSFTPTPESRMLRWALIFFLLAVVAAIFGFGGLAVAFAGVAKILFAAFVVLFIVALISNAIR